MAQIGKLKSVWRASTACVVAMTAFPALGQVPPPPIRQNVDANGVDLGNGSFNTSATDLTIGPAGHQGLAYSRYWTGRGWRSSAIATMNGNGLSPVVSIGGKSESFTRVTMTGSGWTYTNDQGSGSTLIREAGASADYVYTGKDGTIVRFMISGGGSLSEYESQIGWARSFTMPDGTVIKYTYKTSSYSGPAPGGGTYTAIVARIQSINNSSGYQLKFTYAQNTLSSSNVAAWQQPSRITAINNGVEYCDPTADACSLTGTWPRADYTYVTGYIANLDTVTDSASRVWRYGYYGDRLYSIRRPGSAVDDTIIDTSGTDYSVKTLTLAGMTWNYNYVWDDWTGISKTLTITDPMSGVSVAKSTNSQVKSYKDQNLKETTYEYDIDRTKKIIFPELNSLEYTYDSRGNATSQIQHAKPSSGLPDLTTSATYPATCTTPKTCNQPTTTTDALGNVTDYTYDTTHGGVLTVTQPAPVIGGTRPQVRYGYTGLQAYYKVSGSSIVASGVTTYLPTSVSACQTTASCAGTSDETKTTTSYGPQTAGTANNLLPVSATSGSGNGTLAATTAFTYDSVGNPLTVDGPLAGTADTTRTRYDAIRRVIGVAGPDPDGGGTRKHLAQRFTYNADNQITVTDKGTVNSQSDPDWASFAVSETTTSTYDANARKTLDVLSSGGTSYSVMQYSYDALGRTECSALRMNSAIWGSLPSSACTPGTTGTAGPDRISKKYYDAAGQVTKVQTAYGTMEQSDEVQYSYTDNGLRASASDGEGNPSVYQYNGYDRLLALYYPTTNHTGVNWADYEAYTYDANGNITILRLRDGQSIAFTYDKLNRRTVADPAGSATASEPTVTSSYDNLGRLTLALASTGQKAEFGYDALGRRTSEASYWATKTMQYDLAGRRTRLDWHDGFYVNYDYDVTSNVTAIRENGLTSGIGVLATYSYDNLGRRTGITRGNGTTSTYGYDAVSRLNSLVQNPAGSTYDLALAFTHNPAGQIATTTRSNDLYGWTSHYNVDRPYTINGLNQTTAAGLVSLGYDGRGNLNSSGSNTYAYNQLNQLSLRNGYAIYYDPLGRFMYASPTALFLDYDGVELISELVDGTSTVARRYVHGPGTDEPLVWYEGSGTTDRRWLHADERGSIIAVSNDSGVVTNINSYDEYGIPAATNVGRFQYTGQTWIPELGMYNYKARIYSPTLGRFMQTDPIGYGDGMNLYNYVGSDPVNGIDPSGMTTGSLIDTGSYRCPSCVGSSSAGPAAAGASGERGERGLGYWSWTEMRMGNGPWVPMALSYQWVPVSSSAGLISAALGSGSQNTHEFTVPDDGSGDIIVTAPNQIPDSQKYVLAGGRYYLNPHYVDPMPWLTLPNVALASAGTGAAIAILPELGPAGAVLGRGRLRNSSPGVINAGDKFRIGWSWRSGWAGTRNYLGVHGGRPGTPEHWHFNPIPGPK